MTKNMSLEPEHIQHAELDRISKALAGEGQLTSCLASIHDDDVLSNDDKLRSALVAVGMYLTATKQRHAACLLHMIAHPFIEKGGPTINVFSLSKTN